MADREKVIKGLECCQPPYDCHNCPYDWDSCFMKNQLHKDALELLKEQERNEGNCEEGCFEPWDVLWKAPDGTFKGRCDNCGFVHVFIEGHVTQYKFCPQCGEQKQEL